MLSANVCRGIILGLSAFSLIVVVAAYVMCSPLVAGAFYDRNLLHPAACKGGQYVQQPIAGVMPENVVFRSANGSRLHGCYFALPGSGPTVLVSHGIAGNLNNRRDVVNLILSSGASVFIYDYQGYGLSEGKASLSNMQDDGWAAYSYLITTKHLKSQNIILFGESLGSCVACSIAAHEPSAIVFLQSPFLTLSNRLGEVCPLLKIYPDWLFPACGLDNALALHNNPAHVFIIHGQNDPIIPIANADRLYSLIDAPKTLTRVPSAGHTGDATLMKSPLYRQAISKCIAMSCVHSAHQDLPVRQISMVPTPDTVGMIMPASLAYRAAGPGKEIP